MRLALEALFDLSLMLGGTAVGWWAGKGRPPAFLGLAALSLALLVGGAASGQSPYPWTNLPVLAFALAAGAALGCALPPRAQAMGTALALLSLGDLALYALPSPGLPEPGRPAGPFLYGNLVWLLPGGGRLVLGALDLLVATALGAHGRRRGRPLTASLGAAPLGLALAFLFLVLHPTRGLPLLVFLYAGWLITEELIPGGP